MRKAIARLIIPDVKPGPYRAPQCRHLPRGFQIRERECHHPLRHQCRCRQADGSDGRAQGSKDHREAGARKDGEAIADTAWSIVSDSGDPVFDSVGAYASMVLAEGEYTIIAKNRDRIYQRNYTVESGRNEEVEVITTEALAPDAVDGAD